MSQPQGDYASNFSQGSDGNEPGEISISELMNNRILTDEDKKFELDMNDLEMQEMDFDLPKHSKRPDGEVSSPESGEISKQCSEGQNFEIKPDEDHQKEQKTLQNKDIAMKEPMEEPMEEPILEEIPQRIEQEVNCPILEAIPIQPNIKVSPEGENNFLLSEDFSEQPHFTILPEPLRHQSHQENLDLGCQIQMIEQENANETHEVPPIQQNLSIVERQQIEICQIDASSLPPYLIPTNDQVLLKDTDSNLPVIIEQHTPTLDLMDTPSVIQTFPQVLLQPPVKLAKSYNEDLPEFKLCNKVEELPNTKQEANSNGATFGGLIKEKIEDMSDENIDDLLKLRKDDYKLSVKPESLFGIKHILEKNQPENDSNSIYPLIKKNEPSNLLKQFKNQHYEVRNRYFQHQSEIYKKYILDMQNTLQREYEKCRLRQNDVIYQDHCEWEVLDVAENEFCIVVKNELSQNSTIKKVREQNDTEERQKFQNRMLDEAYCMSNEIEDQQKLQQSLTAKQLTNSPKKIYFELTPQISVQFEHLKSQNIQNNSAKFKSYLRNVMLHMSNFVDMTDQLQIVLKMDYKRLIAFYSSIVGPENIIHYESFNCQEEPNNNTIEEEYNATQLQKGQQRQQETILPQQLMEIQEQTNNQPPIHLPQEATQPTDPIILQQQVIQKHAHKNDDFQKHTLSTNPYQGQPFYSPTIQQLSKISQMSNHNQIIVDILQDFDNEGQTPVFGTEANDLTGSEEKEQSHPLQVEHSAGQNDNKQSISEQVPQVTTQASTQQISQPSLQQQSLSHQTQQKNLIPIELNHLNTMSNEELKLFIQQMSLGIISPIFQQQKQQPQQSSLIDLQSQIVPQPSAPHKESIQSQPNCQPSTHVIETAIQKLTLQPESTINPQPEIISSNSISIEQTQPVIAFSQTQQIEEEPVMEKEIEANPPKDTDQMQPEQQKPITEQPQTIIQAQSQIVQAITVAPNQLSTESPQTVEQNKATITPIQSDPFHKPKSNSSSAPVIDIQDDSEESITVPQKQPVPQQSISIQNITPTPSTTTTVLVPSTNDNQPITTTSTSTVTTPFVSAQQVRKVLMETYPNLTDMVVNASDSQILQLYEQLTRKDDLSQSLVIDTIQQPHVAIMNQLPQPIIPQLQQPSSIINHAGQKIIEEKSQSQSQSQSQPIIPIQPQAAEPSLPQQSSQPQKQDLYQELNIIIKALIQNTPEIKDQILQLTKQELLALYREGIQQEKRKDQQSKMKLKNKKKQAQVIDLEDQIKGNQDNSKKSDPVPANPSTSETSPKPAIQSSQVQQPKQLQPSASSIIPPQKLLSFSYLAQYQKRKSQTQQKPLTITSSPIFVNKTLLYQLIQAHDYGNKLKSILMPKQSLKYQSKTQKEISLLYINQLKKNQIAKGPFESLNIKKLSSGDKGLVVLCNKKNSVKDDEFKKIAKEGLIVEVPKMTNQRKNKILELRQNRRQSATGTASSSAIPSLSALPLSIPLLPPTFIAQPALSLSQSQSATNTAPRRRYCLLVEELQPRQEEQIVHQTSLKRVKKSSSMQDEQILTLLKTFGEVINGTQQIELE